jgi:predicted TIM-barrel fold metal-dependent hydrolase
MRLRALFAFAIEYPPVLAELKRRGLIDRTIFATDGPEYAGMVSSYLNRMVDAMRAADYSVDEIAAVLSGNARRVFLIEGTP